MPHLENCLHQDEGWCLDCVKKLWNELEQRNANLSEINILANKVWGWANMLDEANIANLSKIIDLSGGTEPTA